MRIFIAFLLFSLFSPRAWAQVDADFNLGSGDVIQIQIPTRSDLSGQVTVDFQGDIRLPVIGEVHAEGLTSAELGNRLLEMYGILDTSISEVLVTVVEINSQRVTVVGEVHLPGPYSFRMIPGLWDILITAGGMTAQADRSQVQLVRKDPVEGEPRTLIVDLSGDYPSGISESLPTVRSGDSIIVPPLPPGSAGGKQVQVLGNVRTPGLYPLQSAGTVVEALGVSGGTSPDADLGKVRLTRRVDSGTMVYNLDLESYLKNGSPQADLPLRPGDTLFIPERGGLFFRDILAIVPVLTSVVALVIAVDNQ